MSKHKPIAPPRSRRGAAAARPTGATIDSRSRRDLLPAGTWVRIRYYTGVSVGVSVGVCVGVCVGV